MATPRPIGWILLLGACSLWLGFVASASASGFFFVPKDSGLAGGASVFVYGVVGAAVCAIGAGVFAAKASAKSLRVAASVALLSTGLSILLLGYRVVSTRRAQGTGETPSPREVTQPAPESP